MAQKGVAIDLKSTNKSVEQALREIKILTDDDMKILKDRKYRKKPAEIRREKKKVKKLNVKRYNRFK
jgi:hypothetical protein